MDRLDAALAEAEGRAQPHICPQCKSVFRRGLEGRWRKHLLWCGHAPSFQATPVERCEYCRGVCTPAHRRYLDAQRQHAA